MSAQELHPWPGDHATVSDASELRAWVAEHLAGYKAPDRLVVLAELPQTGMMKIDKVDLARQAAATTDDRHNEADRRDWNECN